MGSITAAEGGRRLDLALQRLSRLQEEAHKASGPSHAGVRPARVVALAAVIAGCATFWITTMTWATQLFGG